MDEMICLFCIPGFFPHLECISSRSQLHSQPGVLLPFPSLTLNGVNLLISLFHRRSRRCLPKAQVCSAFEPGPACLSLRIHPFTIMKAGLFPAGKFSGWWFAIKAFVNKTPRERSLASSFSRCTLANVTRVVTLSLLSKGACLVLCSMGFTVLLPTFQNF